MSDGRLKISVRNLQRQQVDGWLSVDDEGYIILELPPPGTGAIDPERDLPELQNSLALLGELAIRRRRNQHRGNPS